MIYTIRWIEIHNPENWGVNREEGKKEILDAFPYEDHWICPDGWLEGVCSDDFECESLEKAREYIGDNYSDIMVYDVYDEGGKLVLTEGY